MPSRDRTPFGLRLRKARLAAGLSQMDVTRAIGVPQSTLNEMEKSAKGSTKWLIPLSALYGVSPSELSDEEMSAADIDPLKSGGSRAGAKSRFLTTSNVTRSLDWERLRVTDKLPDVFRVFLPDDAMAERFPKDSYIEVDTRLQARAGDVVLLRDAEGEHYVRYLRERRKGELVAVADNPAFLPMDLAQDGLEVRAVLVGAGWSGRLT